MRTSRDVGRTIEIAVIDVGLREIQVTQIDLVAELDDVGVPIFELQGERDFGIIREVAERGVKGKKRFPLVKRGKVIEQQRLQFYDDQDTVNVWIEVTDFALLFDGLFSGLRYAGKSCRRDLKASVFSEEQGNQPGFFIEQIGADGLHRMDDLGEAVLGPTSSSIDVSYHCATRSLQPPTHPSSIPPRWKGPRHCARFAPARLGCPGWSCELGPRSA